MVLACRCTVPMTDREMLSSIEEQKKSADIVMQKAQPLRGGASTICGHPYLAAFMLEDAKRLQAQADDERLRALCLEKLIHGRCTMHAIDAGGSGACAAESLLSLVCIVRHVIKDSAACSPILRVARVAPGMLCGLICCVRCGVV